MLPANGAVLGLHPGTGHMYSGSTSLPTGSAMIPGGGAVMPVWGRTYVGDVTNNFVTGGASNGLHYAAHQLQQLPQQQQVVYYYIPSGGASEHSFASSLPHLTSGVSTYPSVYSARTLGQTASTSTAQSVHYGATTSGGYVVTSPQNAHTAEQLLITCRKRHSDEMLAHGTSITGTTEISADTDSIADTKKVKLDVCQYDKPSRVLHCRGVPSDATEGEIIQLGLPFGQVTNFVLAKKKKVPTATLR